MSLKMSNLLDIEKYLLLEPVYFHLPPQYKNRITRETPIKLDEYIDLIEQCGSSTYPGFISRSRHGSQYKRRRQAHFKRIYASSDNLDDVIITGYRNDNYGCYGNSDDKIKSSFVGLAMEDCENNGAVVFSGCEQMDLSSIVLDWGGCLIASLGVVTAHHHKSIDFFDYYMTGILGERNLFGHSKGGNLATYVYINRLDENTNAYCVNAQPYCWYTMSDNQKAALKTDRFEYIVHANDPTRKASYVSYISRTAPLNRYANRHFIDIHGFAEVSFDEFGNLEGTRVIRETNSRLKTRFFNDYATEKRLTHDECLAQFQENIDKIISLPRLLSTTLDEILLVTEAQAAIIWLRDEDTRGSFIYPLIIKGPRAEDLYQLKLRPGQGIAAQSVFAGLPLYIKDFRHYRLQVGSLKRAMGLTITSEIAVPLGIDESEVFGALELVNKQNGFFSVEDFALVNEMTLVMLDVFKKSGKSLDNYRDFSLLQIRKGGKPIFAVEKNGYQEENFITQEEKSFFLKKIMGQSLESDERLIFNRVTFTRDKQDQLKRLRKQEYVMIFENSHLRVSKTRVKTVLVALLLHLRENRINLNALASMIGLEDKMNTSIKDLSGAEYIRLEYGMARIRRPQLIIVNTPPRGVSSAAFLALCSRLKKDCEKKVATVIVLTDK